MSTILDALRKIEEKSREQSLDTRTRLLALSARRLSSSSPRRPMFWIIGASFILAGFVAGIWIARQPAEDFDTSEEGTSLATESPSESAPFHSPLVSRRDPSRGDPLAPDSPSVQRSPFVPARRPSPQLARAGPVSESQAHSDLFERRRSDDEVELEREALTSEPTEVREEQEVQDGRAGRDMRDGRDMYEAIDEGDDLKGRAEHAERAEIVESPDGSVSAPAGSAVSFLQWSPEAARRKAFVRVGDGPLTLVHEGDSISGYTVVEIQQGRVTLRSGTAHFDLHVR